MKLPSEGFFLLAMLAVGLVSLGCAEPENATDGGGVTAADHGTHVDDGDHEGHGHHADEGHADDDHGDEGHATIMVTIMKTVMLTKGMVRMKTHGDEGHGDEGHGEGEHASDHAAFYTVDHYDLEADPSEQLQATLKRATAENKRVLLQVGGDWCGWCKLMTKYIAETESVNQLIAEHYLIQKVTYDQKNKNEAFLSKYPKISGYPHLFVLDAEGELLHSQDTADLEEGKGYSEQAFTEFLTKWSGK